MRQFDESLNRLGKILFTFFSEEKIESHHEKDALLRMVHEQFGEAYMLAKSVQAGYDGIQRLKNQDKAN